MTMTPSQKAEGESRERLAERIAKAALDAYWRDPRRLEAANAAVLALLPSAPAPADAAGLALLKRCRDELHREACARIMSERRFAGGDNVLAHAMKNADAICAEYDEALRTPSPTLPAEAVAGLAEEVEAVVNDIGPLITLDEFGNPEDDACIAINEATGKLNRIAARLRSLPCGTAGAERALLGLCDDLLGTLRLLERALTDCQCPGRANNQHENDTCGLRWTSELRQGIEPMAQRYFALRAAALAGAGGKESHAPSGQKES